MNACLKGLSSDFGDIGPVHRLKSRAAFGGAEDANERPAQPGFSAGHWNVIGDVIQARFAVLPPCDFDRILRHEVFSNWLNILQGFVEVEIFCDGNEEVSWPLWRSCG